MISIVIPTYNEKKNISKIINNLKKIKITNEVIFVDDYSSDGTFNEIVKYRSKRIKGYLIESLKALLAFFFAAILFFKIYFIFLTQ